MPLNKTSIDSDENLAEYVRCCWDCNAPGASSFDWRMRENDPWHFDFTAALGVKVPDLDAASRPEEVFSKFLTEELLEKTAQETNW